MLQINVRGQNLSIYGHGEKKTRYSIYFAMCKLQIIRLVLWWVGGFFFTHQDQITGNRHTIDVL